MEQRRPTREMQPQHRAGVGASAEGTLQTGDEAAERLCAEECYSGGFPLNLKLPLLPRGSQGRGGPGRKSWNFSPRRNAASVCSVHCCTRNPGHRWTL